LNRGAIEDFEGFAARGETLIRKLSAEIRVKFSEVREKLRIRVWLGGGFVQDSERGFGLFGGDVIEVKILSECEHLGNPADGFAIGFDGFCVVTELRIDEAEPHKQSVVRVRQLRRPFQNLQRAIELSSFDEAIGNLPEQIGVCGVQLGCEKKFVERCGRFLVDLMNDGSGEVRVRFGESVKLASFNWVRLCGGVGRNFQRWRCRT
jgi:hypothetical protein